MTPSEAELAENPDANDLRPPELKSVVQQRISILEV
jgi:hypothetical protein